MTPEQINQLRQALIQACDQHLAQGGTIVDGSFREGNNCSCPIGCFIDPTVSSTQMNYTDLSRFLSEKLGFSVSQDQLFEFTDGFDDNFASTSDMFRLGQELRNKYLRSK